MNRTLVARSLRLLLVACFVAVRFPGHRWHGVVIKQSEAAVLLPFAATAASVAALPFVLAVVDRLVQRMARDSTTTPYSALAEASARIRGGSLEQACPGWPGCWPRHRRPARRAVACVEDKLVSAASYHRWRPLAIRRATRPPAVAVPGSGAAPRTVANLAVLLAQPDTDHVVPVLDGPVLRAVLAIGKPGRRSPG